MKPLCPACLNEMSKAASFHNMFNCSPCREIIQFFGAGVHADTRSRIKPPLGPERRIKQIRAA